MNGSVTIIDKGNVRVHSYMAPEASLNVTTQLIETPGRLIAVDGQVNVADADEVVEYAKGWANRWTGSSSPTRIPTTSRAPPVSRSRSTPLRSSANRWQRAATFRT